MSVGRSKNTFLQNGTPTLHEPARGAIDRAMAIALEILSSPVAGRDDDMAPMSLGSLFNFMAEEPDLCPQWACSAPATQWAIYEHITNGRLQFVGGSVRPTPELWKWGRDTAVSGNSIAGDPYFTPRDIAARLGRDLEQVRKTLERWRNNNPSLVGSGWVELQDPRKGYLYRLSAISSLFVKE